MLATNIASRVGVHGRNRATSGVTTATMACANVAPGECPVCSVPAGHAVQRTPAAPTSRDAGKEVALELAWLLVGRRRVIRARIRSCWRSAMYAGQ